MKVIKGLKKTNKVCLNCNNHTGCTSDTTPEGGGLECGGSVKD